MHGDVSLIIRGDKLEFNQIQKSLLEPTKTYKKGEYISKVIEPVTEDIWIYSVEYDNQEIDIAVRKLLELFINKFSFINNLAKTNGIGVTIRCSIQSDYAQMYYELSNESLKILSDLNIKLCFSILSWGGVEN